ncbi:oligopeptidase A [Deinococcus roseus]|uniref:oligopeptidase A n=2 Tax=Deinococcus roseus TaxID=392414 RepID=A0ABQ2CY56_9DEIO|nr:oligopeptidase A [Deinococcus roseus]
MESGYTFAMNDNPLLSLGFDLPFEDIKPEHFEAAIDVQIQQAEQELKDLLEVQGERTYLNTLKAYDRLAEPLTRSYILLLHLNSVVTGPEVRATLQAVQPKVTSFFTRFSLSQPLYQALKDYAATPDAQFLTGAKRRLLELALDDFRRSGADLPAEKKQRMEEINMRLSEICTQFSQNVVDSTAEFEHLIEDESKLAGLPASARAAARQNAESKGKPGWRFTLQQPSYLPVIFYLDDPEIRKAMYTAYNQRGSEDPYNNEPLINEILALRKEKAELLGYQDFADLVLEDRMAKNGARALQFEQDMTLKIRPFFERENAELMEYRRALEGEDAPELEPWDVSYYAEKLRKASYDFDEEALKPYFAVDRVMAGLFEITRRVYGVTIQEVKGVQVWHPEVKTYEIYNEAGQLLARFFADWFPRESKRSGAWMNSFMTGDRDGAFEPHLCLMCGNLTPPVGDEPALLTHSDVETIFHEWGHLIHHALSDVEVKKLAGTNVAWDFVELPSQIMENWAWEREALDLFAHHHQTGETIPDELFEKMVAARNFRAASVAMRQLSLGTTDLMLHMKYNPEADGSVLDYSRNLLGQFMAVKPGAEFKMITAFTHLFASPVGYGAGYYSYKWAEVLDADAFSRFREEGIFNRATGQDFLDKILSRGASEDPAKLFRDFMGRDPNPDALLERSGLLV